MQDCVTVELWNAKWDQRDKDTKKEGGKCHNLLFISPFFIIN